MARSENPPPLDKLINGEWHKRAACVGMDTEIFFPEEAGSSKTEEYERKAMETCWNECAVREECLEEELEWSTPWDAGGIRGGTKMAQRRRMRKERKEAAA